MNFLLRALESHCQAEDYQKGEAREWAKALDSELSVSGLDFPNHLCVSALDFHDLLDVPTMCCLGLCTCKLFAGHELYSSDKALRGYISI